MAAITTTSGAHSIPALFLERARQTPAAEAYRYPAGEGWESLTWGQAAERVRQLSVGLRQLGVRDEDRVAILCSTRVEWILADLAVLAAAGATTTVYPSNTAEECAFIVGDSDSRVVIAEDQSQVDKLRSVRAELPDVRHVVVIDGDASDDGWVTPLSAVEALGRDNDDAQEHEATVARIMPDQLATLIYTSGTTGRPKGVELTHDNWVYAAEAVAQLGILNSEDLHFLWLPMSHSFGKVLEVVMIDLGIASVVDGRVERIAVNLGEVRPTIVAGAPRIFEKVHNGVVLAMQAEGGLKLKLFRWARNVGIQVSRNRQEGRPSGAGLRLQHAVADRLVFSKLRARFGGRIRYFISGSAPLSREMAEFFDAAGMTILEGYGLTESSAGSFLNRPESVRFGTVGPPLPGTEVRIADDGEIMIRGRGIMRGYHDLPSETAAALVDGWLLTGDIGEVDDVGRLRITDRKKELIKTSGGKYVAPQLIEGRIKSASPYIGNVVVYGDRRNYITALVTLDPEAIGPWAREQGLPEDSVQLATHDAVQRLVAEAVERINSDLARHETVKKFSVLASDFTVESGDLTPSLKIRRRVVETRYADVLDSMYESAVEQV